MSSMSLGTAITDEGAEIDCISCGDDMAMAASCETGFVLIVSAVASVSLMQIGFGGLVSD